MDASEGDLAGRLAIAIGRINRRIRPDSAELSHGMLSLLSTIVRLGPLRPSDIARIEVIAPPTATRALGDLEAHGYVSRASDPDDRRSSLISATDAGAAAVLRARAARARLISELMTELDDAEERRLAGALEVLEAMARARQP